MVRYAAPDGMTNLDNWVMRAWLRGGKGEGLVGTRLHVPDSDGAAIGHRSQIRTLLYLQEHHLDSMLHIHETCIGPTAKVFSRVLNHSPLGYVTAFHKDLQVLHVPQHQKVDSKLWGRYMPSSAALEMFTAMIAAGLIMDTCKHGLGVSLYLFSGGPLLPPANLYRAHSVVQRDVGSTKPETLKKWWCSKTRMALTPEQHMLGRQSWLQRQWTSTFAQKQPLLASSMPAKCAKSCTL